MTDKLKILRTAAADTQVLEGGRRLFCFYFYLTHGINFIEKKLPRTARTLRNAAHFIAQRTPRSTRTFVIKNNTGIFEVVPFNDSMTISADYFETQLLAWPEKPAHRRVFIDIGAHIGRYTILALSRFHYDTVVAVEANPATFATLKKNIALNGMAARAIAVPVALSDREGTIEFETNRNNLAVGHVITGGTEKSPHAKVITVATKKLSTILDEQHVSDGEIDFIKMDVEGFENQVLEGMKNVLAKMQAGSCVMIEISNPSDPKARDILEQNSFHLVGQDRADYLFIKS